MTNDKMTLKYFEENYFYKTDLIKMCRDYGLPTYGTKAELNNYLRSYLSNVPLQNIKSPRTRKSTPSLTFEQITLDTKLIGSGFSFNNAARKFFAVYFGVEKFSFKKEMAIIKRQAETDNDTEMTVGDLLSEYVHLQKTDNNQSLLGNTAEESTYQWNNFLKDFCKSDESHNFNDKLKVASILWKHIKSSSQPKKYTDELLTDYQTEISCFQK